MAANMYDLLVIGGGINGVGVARDAVGRGFKVLLVEQEDLASHTSSASTKLIHGGLRYLEHYDFALVRKALGEREILLRAAPHIIWPLRFVLPVVEGMRPAWLLRLGLFLYDHLGKRELLPGTDTLRLRHAREGAPLHHDLVTGFAYSDCWVDDARLVALNAVDFVERGGELRTRVACTGLKREDDHWRAELSDGTSVAARMVINAGGPFVDRIIAQYRAHDEAAHVRLVKGSHIIVPRLHDGDWAYMFQQEDGRIIFAIPYEDAFTLIGTTEVSVGAPEAGTVISEAETAYLVAAANRYFLHDITAEDVVWSYAGVRPLYEDHAKDASAVTRDFVLALDEGEGENEAPILSIFGGKITTYRELAETVLERVEDALGAQGAPWTARAHLPGGDFAVGDIAAERQKLQAAYPALDAHYLHRLFRCYGSKTKALLGDPATPSDLGRDFGGTLTETEVRYLVAEEFALQSDDILWRRTKCGLHMRGDERDAFASWFAENYPHKIEASGAD